MIFDAHNFIVQRVLPAAVLAALLVFLVRNISKLPGDILFYRKNGWNMELDSGSRIFPPVRRTDCIWGFQIGFLKLSIMVSSLILLLMICGALLRLW